jgi:hypothetical protein
MPYTIGEWVTIVNRAKDNIWLGHTAQVVEVLHESIYVLSCPAINAQSLFIDDYMKPISYEVDL